MLQHTAKMARYAIKGPLAANLDEYAQPDERALPEGFHFNEYSFSVTPDPYDLTTFEGRNEAENPLQGIELLQALPYSEYQIARVLSEAAVCPNKGSYVMLMVAEVLPDVDAADDYRFSCLWP